MSIIVRVSWIVLYNHSQNTSDKLYVWSKRTERIEDRCNTKFLVIKTFAKHLDLDNTVERSVFQISNNIIFFRICKFTMDDFCFIPSLDVQRPNLFCVANR